MGKKAKAKEGKRPKPPRKPIQPPVVAIKKKAAPKAEPERDVELGAKRKKLKKIRNRTLYYPHQTEGVRRMAKMRSFILADEMGLGKTLQALTVAAIDFEVGLASRVLIVAPATLKWNWQDEIKKFTKFTSHVLDGTPAQRSIQLDSFREGETDILIVNYEQVQKHLAELNRLRFQIVVFDEAHMMKNHRTARTKACLQLMIPRSFILTGSPVLNRVDELWPLLHRIDAEKWPRYWPFVNRYAIYGGFKNKEIKGVKFKEELNLDLANVMVRRLKKDVLDLPEKQIIQVFVDLHPEQKRLYKEAQEELKLNIPDNPNEMDLENAMVRMLRLKQICGTTACFMPEDYSSKLDRLEELVQESLAEENCEPLVVFTQFRDVQAAIIRRMGRLGIETFALNGDTPMSERKQVVDQWGAYPVPTVLVAMLQVASVGLNMTAASRAFFVDKLYVPKLNEQAQDRLHRIGAKQTVQIYELMCRGTVEQRIEVILRSKTKLFTSIVEESKWKSELYKQVIKEIMEETP